MKICDLTQWYTPASGGIRTYIDARREFILEHSSDEHVLITPGERDEARAGARWRTYRLAGPVLRGCRPYRVVWRVDRVWEILERERPDVIELGSPYAMQWVTAAHRRRHPCLVVGFYHTDFPDAYVRPTITALAGPRSGEHAARLATLCARGIFARCDLVVAASPLLLRKIEALGVRRTLLVDLGVDVKTFHPGRRDRSVWRAMGLDPDRPVLIYCGRLDREKRAHLLVEAFLRLDPRRAQLVLLGEGVQRDALASRAAGDARVRILPFEADRGRLATLLASADVYVTAGPHETFALSVLEAQACGLPVAGVRAGALIERVPAGLGHLAAVDAPEELADCMERCLEEDPCGTGARVRAWVEKRYAWEHCFRREHAAYAELLSAAHGRADTARSSGARDLTRQPAPAAASSSITRNLFRRAAGIILAGIALHLIMSLWLTDPRDWAILERLSAPHLALALLLALLPWFGNALRVYNWLRWLGLRVRYRQALRIVLCAELGAAVTPTALGGAPVKAGMLMNLGLPIGRAISLTSLGTLEDALIVLLLVPLGIAATALRRAPGFADLPARLPEHAGAVAIGLGVLLAAGAAALAARQLRRRDPLRRWTARLRRIAGDFLDLYRFVGRRGLPRLAGNLPICALQWFTRYSVLTALMAGLGVPVEPIRIALLQWFCFALMAVAPTPGATGGAEAAFLLIHGPHVPAALAGVLLTGWRFLTFYFLSLTAIAVLLAIELRGRARRPARPRSAHGSGSASGPAPRADQDARRRLPGLVGAAAVRRPSFTRAGRMS